MASSAEGKVEIIKQGLQEPVKTLPIENMNCSAVLGDFLFIGAYSKLYMIDLKDDFNVVGNISMARHIFSICIVNSYSMVVSQQGG